MLIVQICIGSSCYIKGSEELVEMMEKAIAEHHLEDDVVLTGSFCTGRCNRIGVTIQVNDDVHVGITRDNFYEFFNKNILEPILKERE